jgi:Spy/CpxP family protein refolding chaperone
MKTQTRLVAGVAGFTILVGFAIASLRAQEPDAAARTGVATQVPEKTKGAFDPARRVPAYFGQIGLTAQQRDKIYQLQGKELKKVQDLQMQITSIRTDMMKQCEAVLTDTQKQLLDQRRKAAAANRAPASGTTPAPTPAPTGSSASSSNN